MKFFSSLYSRHVLPTIALALALSGPFIFPFYLTAAFALIAGYVIPIVPFLVGVMCDLLYLPPDTVPYMTVLGIISTSFLVFVRYLIKTRIM